MRYRESEIQKAIVRALRYIYPRSLVFSIPNEGKRTPGMVAALRDNGLLHGTSDLILLHLGLVIFIEVKDKGRGQTEYQKQFQEQVEKQGHRYWLVRSVDEVLTSVENLTLITNNSNEQNRNQNTVGA